MLDSERRALSACAIALAGLLLFDLMSAGIKMLSHAYPAEQLSLIRNIIGIVPTLGVLLASRRTAKLSAEVLSNRQVVLGISRGVLISIAQLFFYISLAHVELATATTLIMLSPIFVCGISLVFLRLRVSGFVWLASLLGFGGAGLIVGPNEWALSSPHVFAIIAAVFYALNTVTIRLFAPAVAVAAINLLSQTSAIAFSLGFAVVMSRMRFDASSHDLALFILIGLLGGGGSLLLVKAYRMAEASVLAPLDYCSIIFAFFIGYVVFGEAPFDRLLPGAIFISVGGLIMLFSIFRRPFVTRSGIA